MTTCPNCRTICEDVPVRDRSTELISLISNDSDETAEPIDTNRFAQLMAEIQAENDEEEVGEQMDGQEATVPIDLALFQGAGTFGNPLDLTNM